MIVPKHVFDPFKGAKSREAPANLKPIGTGPYRLVDFKPGDIVRGEANPAYHVPNRPFFDAIEMKGGGDAVSAARAVLQTGEYDYAWNLQVEDDILRRHGAGRQGPRQHLAHRQPGAHAVQLHRPVDRGRRRAVQRRRRPTRSSPTRRCARPSTCSWTGPRSRRRSTGAAGRRAPTSSPRPRASTRRNTRWEFNVDKANQVLDAAGWKRGADGIRAKDGKRLKFLFQTSINAPRQKTQAIVKQAAAKAGIEIEIKSVVASVFFSSDPANPDTYPHFYADLQMYNTTMTAPDPQYFMNQFCSWEASQKANKWQGRNITRFRNDEYDRTYNAADSELDPVKRAALFIKMNDLVIANVVVIPVLWRNGVSGSANALQGMDLTGWDSTFWRLPYWYKQS